MWAEVTLEAKQDLPEDSEALRNAFQARFGPPTDKRAAIDKTTIWAGNYNDLDHMVYTHHNNERVFLVYQPERSTIRVYVESSKHQRKYGPLWRLIEELGKGLKRLLRGFGNRMSELKYIIYDDGWEEIEDGRELSIWSKVKRSAKEHVPAKIYVPIATYVASIALGSQQAQALRNVLVAIAATVLWIVIDALIFQPRPSYEKNVRR